MQPRSKPIREPLLRAGDRKQRWASRAKPAAAAGIPAGLQENTMRAGTAVTFVLALSGAAALAQGAMAQGMAQPSGAAIVTQARTVSELAAICDPAWGGVPRLEAIAYCQGFLTSFGQNHALVHPPGGATRPLFCVPVPGPTVAQSGVAFAAWARDNPRYVQEPALDGLLRWAQANFPCPTRSPARSAR